MTRNRSKQELIEASGHLCYEIWMLDHMGLALAKGLAGIGPIHNAFINSFAIHVRNIIDFLYESKGDAKHDAILAEHYFPAARDWTSIRPELPEGLKKVKIRCDKQVAHLTYTRKKKESWDFKGIVGALHVPLSVFMNSIDRALLGFYFKPIEHIFK